MATSASRCLFLVSSQVSLSAMTSKFSSWMSVISSSILGDNDCTLAVSTSSRVLGCINLPAFVGEGFPYGDDRGICGVWSTVGCCRPRRSLLFLLVAVIGTVGDRPLQVFIICFDRDRFCCLWPSFNFVNNHLLKHVFPHAVDLFPLPR